MTYEDFRKAMKMGPHDPSNNEDLLVQAFFLGGQAQGVSLSIEQFRSNRIAKKEDAHAFAVSPQ